MATSFLTDADIAQFDAQQAGSIPPFLTDTDIAKFDQTSTPPAVSTPKWPSEQPPSFAEKFYDAIEKGVTGIKEKIVKPLKTYEAETQKAFKWAVSGMPKDIKTIEKVTDPNYTWVDTIKDAYPMLKDPDSRLARSVMAQFGTEVSGMLLEAGTKPSTYAIWGAAERLVPIAIREAFKRLPPSVQQSLIKERFLWGKHPVELAYKELGLKKGASVENVENAYREMALKWHPDRAPAGQATKYTHNFIKGQGAYDKIKVSMEAMKPTEPIVPPRPVTPTDIPVVARQPVPSVGVTPGESSAAIIARMTGKPTPEPVKVAPQPAITEPVVSTLPSEIKPIEAGGVGKYAEADKFLRDSGVPNPQKSIDWIKSIVEKNPDETITRKAINVLADGKVNPRTRQAFELVTGQKLPATQKESKVILERLAGLESNKQWLTAGEVKKAVGELKGKMAFLDRTGRNWKAGRQSYLSDKTPVKIIEVDGNRVIYSRGKGWEGSAHIDDIRDIVVDGKSYLEGIKQSQLIQATQPLAGKVEPEITPAMQVKPSEKFVKAITPTEEPRITVTSETTPETIQKKLKELPLFPNKTENLSLLAKALQKAPDTWSGDKTDRVMVKVDGTWQIENSKTAIQKAIEGIRKPKLTPEIKEWKGEKEGFRPIKRTPSLFRPVSEAPKAAKIEEIGDLVPTEGNKYFTDGTMLIKGTPPVGSKFQEKPQLTEKAIKEILNEKTKPAELQFYFTDTPEGISGRSDIPIATLEDFRPPYVVFKSGGKDVVFLQNRYNAIRNRFPEAKYGIRLSDDKGDMLIAYKDKEPVAGLMAMKDVKIPPTEQDTNQQLQTIIRNSKSMAEAQKTIKKDLDMDITIADLKAAELQTKGGAPPDLSRHIIDDLTAKIKGKNKNADNDYGLSTIADITPDEVDDLVSTMGIARERASGVLANIRKGVYSLEMPQNFLYAYPDTKPIAEGVITTSVKQWKSDSEIESFRKIAIKPDHPEVLAKIAVEADRDNSKNIFAMINTAIKEGKLNTTDRDAYFKGYYFLNKFVRDSLIKEITDSRLGIRLKSDGWRYHVKYQTPSGVRVKAESKVSDRWVGGEELDKLQKTYSVDVIEQKERVIFRHVDPNTGKYVTRTEEVDNYDQAVEMMGEEAKKLVDEILPYKNYIPHNRKGGKFWVEAFEPSVSGEPETKIFSARVPMRVNAEAIEKSLKAKFPRAKVTINPHSEKMKFMPSMGSMADVQFFMMKNGIDPKSEAGQRIINAYRSMSPLMSHLIHAQNIAGFKTDWNSITEGITDMAKSAVKREYRLDIKDLRELTKDIKDDFRYNTAIKYLDALLGATGEGNALLDAGKGLMYFWLLANKGTYIIQNMSEPLWAWARLGKINHPTKFMLHLPREYTNLIKQASEEGILKPFFELETVKEKGVLFHLDVLGKRSEALSSKNVFELGLRVARDKGLTGDEAYEEAYQFLFNIGKPFYNIANKPIFTIGPGFEGFRRYAFVLLNWTMDFVNKAFRGGAGFKAPVNRMLKTLLGWILLAGVGTLPFGRKLLKRIGWVPKNPKYYTMKDKFLLAGAAGVAGVSPNFLIPIFQRWFKYGQFQGTGMGVFRGMEIIADKLLKVKSEYKKYGIAGALGQLPMAGAQYPIAGIAKLKQGVKTGGVKPKVIYKPKSMWEKIVTAAGLTSFELGEYYEGKKTKKGKPSSLIIPKMK